MSPYYEKLFFHRYVWLTIFVLLGSTNTSPTEQYIASLQYTCIKYMKLFCICSLENTHLVETVNVGILCMYK